MSEAPLKIKRLAWRPVVGSEKDLYAPSPTTGSGGVFIHFEEGKYWASWDPTIPPVDDPEPLKDMAQVFHGAYFMRWLERI